MALIFALSLGVVGATATAAPSPRMAFQAFNIDAYEEYWEPVITALAERLDIMLDALDDFFLDPNPSPEFVEFFIEFMDLVEQLEDLAMGPEPETWAEIEAFVNLLVEIDSLMYDFLDSQGIDLSALAPVPALPSPPIEWHNDNDDYVPTPRPPRPPARNCNCVNCDCRGNCTCTMRWWQWLRVPTQWVLYIFAFGFIWMRGFR